MGSDEEAALEHFRCARQLAENTLDEREARWGELMCNSALERPEAHALLSELVESTVPTDPTDQVRMADRQLAVGFRSGAVSGLENSRRALELVDQVDDAFVRCSFLGVHSWALALGAYYDEALAVTRRLSDQASELRFESPVPYAHATAAVALAGLQRFEAARAEIERAARTARRLSAEHALQNAYAIEMRVLLQSGAVDEACATEPPSLENALRSMRGEVLASRALALATIGRLDEAEHLAEDAASCTKGVEAHGLVLAVRAVCALKRRSRDLIDRCDALVAQTFQAGSVDLTVTAYRANPELLPTFLVSGRVRDEVVYLVRRAGDVGRAEALGLSLNAVVDPASVLSTREREVYDLVCEGLSNAEIGRRLYISPSTVKVHVHHVFDKLGVRSRGALALDAARKRYATSAATTGGDSAASTDGGTTVPKPTPRAVR
jgi:DNA-binding CsgD family transcriptional regulator/tetratricopeptide (TPR) repeat protein